MEKTLMTAMKTSISEVMETMFFLPVEFGEESTFDQLDIVEKQSSLASQLKFSGDVTGSLSIIVSNDLISEMTQNFTGESQDQLTNEYLSGTLTEMLNMVCGNALSKTDSKIPFDLEIPEVIDASKISKKEVFTIVETTGSNMAVSLKID